ncbi:MAG TPA: lycopene cyclase domain-containing protein [Propionibacteriaceae bacterium]|nr:lycopene cyclase domain-containing protein [Propionibacteriaceae bacterium]
MPEYTVLTVIAVAAVVALELLWFRTGIFQTAQYWVSMAIVFAFQVIVDGWLTKLSDPIVIYDDSQMLGIRIPWDVPVEDYGFGFAMVTLAILVWRRLLDRSDTDDTPAEQVRPGKMASGRSRQPKEL